MRRLWCVTAWRGERHTARYSLPYDRMPGNAPQDVPSASVVDYVASSTWSVTVMKRNFGFEKRQKEQAKQHKKQEKLLEKQQRRQERANAEASELPATPPAEDGAPPVLPPVGAP